MALSGKNLQRKKKKKAQKRKVCKKNIAAPATSSVDYRGWPVYESWVSCNLWDEGVGYAVLSRRLSKDHVVFITYLVDVYCTGVEVCGISQLNEDYYRDLLERYGSCCGELEPVAPEYVKTLILQAIAYAERLGFPAHRDYHRSKTMLQGISVDDSLQFTFGLNGKPFYIQEPHESAHDVKIILDRLERLLGKGNYDFALPVDERSYVKDFLQPLENKFSLS